MNGHAMSSSKSIQHANKYFKYIYSAMIICDLLAVSKAFQLYQNPKINLKWFERKYMKIPYSTPDSKLRYFFALTRHRLLQPVEGKGWPPKLQFPFEALVFCNESIVMAQNCLLLHVFWFLFSNYSKFWCKDNRSESDTNTTTFTVFDASGWFPHLWTPSAKNESNYTVILLLETSALSYMQFLGAESSRNVTGDSFTNDSTLSPVITPVFPNHNGPESGSFWNHHSDHPLQSSCFLDAN